MSEKTRQRLDAHHGGEHFHDLMLQGFDKRFGEAFWSYWAEHIVVHHGPAPTYLDLGCGPGLMLRAWHQRWPQATLHGVELQPYMLDTARKVAQEVGATLHEADLHTMDLPLPDASCDLAVVIATLGEIPDRYAAMLELRRVLKPGARLAVSEELPDPGYLPGRAVRTVAEEAGFRLKGKTGSFFCYHMVFVNSYDAISVSV